MTRHSVLITAAAICLGALFAGSFIHYSKFDLPANITSYSKAQRWAEGSPERSQMMVSLPNDWVIEPAMPSIQRYQFIIEDDLFDAPLLGVLVPNVEMAPALYLNGYFLGGDRSLDNPLPRYWNRPVYISFPKSLLRSGGNELEIRVAANGQWGRLSQIHVGDHRLLAPEFDRLYNLRVSLPRFIQIFCLLTGCFLVVLFFMRREPVFIAFAAFSFSWFVHSFLVTTIQFSISNRILDWAIYSSAGVLLASYSYFTFRLLELRWRVWEWSLLSVTVFGLLALYASSMFDVRAFNDLGSKVWIGSLGILAIVPFVAFIRDLLDNFTWAKALLISAYSMGFVFAIWDWSVVSGLGYRHIGLFLQYAAIPILISYGIILCQQFISALRARDQSNIELEKRVSLKSAELEKMYQANAGLLKATSIAEERDRIMRDMHDGVGGHLISALSQLKNSEHDSSSIVEEVELALTDLRLMIDSSDAVDNNIVVALGLLRNRMESRFQQADIELNWQVGDLSPIDDLGPERLLHFLRILQECFTNAIRHSKGHSLTVKTFENMDVDGFECSGVVISDDGVGFLAESASGRGLKNMEHRAKAARLQLSIKSRNDGIKGTQVAIGFPV